MCEKNITPAIDVPNDTPKELSAEEFQQRLYDWFQERGLLTELRAHLRKQMIGVLKDSPVGHTVTAQQSQCFSPKVQALNLLIVEFLLYNNYHYTLSVFSTEAPTINVLSEFPLPLTSTEQQTKNKQWRFTDKDMCEILETLGIQRESELGEKVFQSYYKNDEAEPLLTNIMNCIRLSNKTVQSSPSCENVFACTSYEEWLKSIGELLHVNNISTANIKDILNTIMNLVENERKRIKNETVEEFLKNKAILEEEFAKKHEEQIKKWSTVTNSLEREKSILINEQTRKQIEAEQANARMLKHQNLLQDRYHNLVMREREVQRKEYSMRQREDCVEAQRQRLQVGFDALYREQRDVENLQVKLHQEITDQRAKFNVTFFDNIQKVMSKQQPTTSKENNEEAAVDIADKSQSYHQELIVQLQIENRALQNVNLEQKARIDELTERSSLLLRDLESTQAAVNILSSSSTALNSVLTAPPLLPPTSYSFDGNGGRSVIRGGGENRSRGASPQSLGEFRNATNSRDVRRRLPSRRVNGFSSSSTDEVTTSQMLKDARNKLKRLEQESDEVDRQYQRFKLKKDPDVFSLPCRYRTYENIPILLTDMTAENASRFGNIEDPQKPSTSSSSLMEYVPYRTQLTTPQATTSKYRSPEQTSVKAGPSKLPTVAVEKIEDAVCKDTENTTSSSGLDLGTSGMSFSHIDSSEEKTTTEQ